MTTSGEAGAGASATWSGQRIERRISYLLIAGVLLSALLVVAGAVIYLARHGADVPDYHTFRGEPARLRTIHGLLSWDNFRHGRGLIQLGLVVLILTPIARVAFSLVAFVAERDRMYALVSAIVLGLLLYSLTSA